ncbi:MAG: response regulator transcription factor [Alphaproteobacteria bacterium]|nr:response regulator transcription factor [Alphaproteobacteria bacterium]
MKILLIEDDDETAAHVSAALRKEGHWVERATGGIQGLSFAASGLHDLIIVDRMLPELDGLSVVKELRARGSKLPILFLTTMSGIHDRVDGLEAGADDYLTKPFALAELLARVSALSRRLERSGAEVQTVLRVGALEADLMTQTVRREGQPIDLQPQEFRLLEYLMRHAGQVVTRAMLLENTWQLHFDPGTNIVESHMSRLRAKLNRGFDKPLIQTMRGAGYVLRLD